MKTEEPTIAKNICGADCREKTANEVMRELIELGRERTHQMEALFNILPKDIPYQADKALKLMLHALQK